MGSAQQPRICVRPIVTVHPSLRRRAVPLRRTIVPIVHGVDTRGMRRPLDSVSGRGATSLQYMTQKDPTYESSNNLASCRAANEFRSRRSRSHQGRAEESTSLRGRATSCIFIWLGGGAAQIDTWDPKVIGDPKQGSKKPGSAYPAIDTAIAGVQVCEHLPRMAARLDRGCIIRSVNHDVIDEHAAAVNRMHVGRAPDRDDDLSVDWFRGFARTGFSHQRSAGLHRHGLPQRDSRTRLPRRGAQLHLSDRYRKRARRTEKTERRDGRSTGSTTSHDDG